MNDPETAFRVRLGRIRDQGPSATPRARRFVAEVIRAAVRAGYGGGRLQPRSRVSRSAFGRGRGVALASALRSPARRVVVKVRIVRHAGGRFQSAPLALHMAYLKREGVDREGGAGRLFGAEGEADGRAFAERCNDDRRHFRMMVSPEDGAQLRDLKATTRDLMRLAERDLGTKLDWIAAEHWNTEHPHVHVLIRGRDQDGADLVISRDYIARGFRARAEALVSLELGPRSAREIAADLERQVAAERFTALDRLLQAQADEGRLDLRPGAGAPERDLRPLLLGRARTLERLGLARDLGPGRWTLSDGFELRLRELGERGDIIKTLHRAMGAGRALSDYALAGEQARDPIIGRLVERGLFDEHAGSAYVIVDALDGRAHHVRLPDLGAAGDTPVGGLVEVHPALGDKPVRLVHRSDLAIEDQVLASGATWLDRQLVTGVPASRGAGGFGAEVSAALQVRAEHLESLGLATRAGSGWRFADRLLADLRRRELDAAAAQLARDAGRPVRSDTAEAEVVGVYRRRVDLASGRFAVIEDGLGFRLAPWARALDRYLGQEVRGRVHDRGVEWDLGRARGLER